MIDRAGGTPHIFNLGHGILPHMSVDAVKHVVGYVHEHTAR